MKTPSEHIAERLPRLPEPWNMVDEFRFGDLKDAMSGSDADIATALDAATLLSEALSTMPRRDRSAVADLSPSTFDLRDGHGWGHLFDILDEHFVVLEDFDRGFVREQLEVHGADPEASWSRHATCTSRAP